MILSIYPGLSLLKASLVGANSVKWPGWFNLSITSEVKATVWKTRQNNLQVRLRSYCDFSKILSICFTYSERGEVGVHLQEVPNGVADDTDDPVNHVHHSVCGHLVPMDDSGTVYRHNLHGGTETESHRH